MVTQQTPERELRSLNNSLAEQTVLHVTFDGTINEVAWSSGATAMTVGSQLTDLFDPDYRTVVHENLRHASEDIAMHGFRSKLQNTQDVYVFIWKETSHLTVILLVLSNEIMQLFDEMVQINNEYLLQMRRLYKRLSLSGDDVSLFEEIMRVNNELINTRRDLNRKNLELEHLNRELEEINDIDFLTRIFNRRRFFKDIYALVQRQEAVLTMMDFNNFKRINDEFGHAKGDETLRMFASRMQELLAPSGGTLYRLGGDEFAVLTSRGDNPDWTDLIATIDKELQHIHPLVSLSYGSVAVDKNIVNEMKRAEQSMAKADAQMYRMKRRYYESLNQNEQVYITKKSDKKQE